MDNVYRVVPGYRRKGSDNGEDVIEVHYVNGKSVLIEMSLEEFDKVVLQFR